MTKLNYENVMAVAKDCLFTDAEMPDEKTTPEGAVIVDGIINRYAFHPARLESHRSDIATMLDDLPAEFRSDGGGGWSFLQACVTKHGEHWAEHPTMGMLFALGMGLGIVTYSLPRDMWNMLPGGMPYLALDAAQLPAAV